MDYTKGEWKVEATDVRSRYPFVILGDGMIIARIEDEGNSGIPEANANLIAAAPDMYEALKEAYKHIPEGRNVKTLIEKALAKAEVK